MEPPRRGPPLRRRPVQSLLRWPTVLATAEPLQGFSVVAGPAPNSPEPAARVAGTGAYGRRGIQPISASHLGALMPSGQNYQVDGGLSLA